MSNLLKDASILLTPTAYDNGRMNATKPYKDLEGPELVTNGDFSQGTQDWTFNTNGNNQWSVPVSEKASYAGTATDFIITNNILTVGKKYRVSFNILDTNGSTIRLSVNSEAGGSFEDYNGGDGLYTTYLTAGTNYLRIGGSSSGAAFSIDNVSVVEDLSGDFQFERNSAATRVNAQGLVENVQILSPELVSNGNFSQIGTEEVLNGNFSQEGSELVTNGDFSNGLNNWSVNGGSYATIVDGALNSNNTENGSWFAENISQNISFVNGKIYKVTFKAKNISGALNLRITHQSHIVFNDNLTSNFVDYTVYYTAQANNDSIRIFCNDDVGEFQIDNVSVKEVGQNWELDTGWSIGDDKVEADGTSAFLIQSNFQSVASVKSYKIQYEVLSTNGVNIRFGGGSSMFGTPTLDTATIGIKTIYLQSNGTVRNLQFQNNLGFIGSITNISVKEVGQDWTIENTWTIGDGVANGNGANGNTEELVQSLSFDSSKKYKISYQILNYVSGSVRYSLSGGGGYNGQNKSANGTYVDIVNTGASHNQIKFFGLNFNGSVSNISVKEITDDTNIPRINYEGFSYQDALGSEEIVNGDFSNGSANWNSQLGWTFSNGLANFENLGSSNRNLWQSPLVAGKSYKLSFEIISISSGYIRNVNSSITDDVQFSTVGVHTQYFTADNVNLYLKASSDANLSIDNVSVKEVTGQEVVPDSGCGSWLLEPQSTNLIPYSEDFSHSSWIKNSTLIVTSNAITSPSGETNASRVNKAGSGSRLGVEIPITSGQSYTFSFYMKNNGGVTGFETSFDGQSASQSYTITDNWERYEFTFLATVTETSQIRLFQGAVDIDAYIWGAQLEQLSYATSYIPTNGATNTRLQDIANNSGNSTLINSTEGVLYAEIEALADDNTLRNISINDGTYSNTILLRYLDFSNQIQAVVRIGNSFKGICGFTLADITENTKVAYKWKSGDFALWINGTEVDTSFDIGEFAPNILTELSFDRGDGAKNFYGKNKALAVYKEALTDANLRCLTYPNPVATTFDLDFDTIAEQFTFTRGSEATFVNEQGLIESTNQLGPELVTNGDFATDGDWVKGAGYTISNGSLIATNTVNNSLTYQNKTYPIGIYKVTANVTITSGALRFQIGGAFVSESFTTSGIKTAYIIVTSQQSYFGINTSSANSNFSIDNVSVEEVITATNTPRIDYSTGAKAFLLEPQSTNLITYSEDFGQSYWNLAGGDKTSGQLSPNGDNSAYRIDFDGSNIGNFLRSADITLTADTTYTASWYIKNINLNDITRFRIETISGGGTGAVNIDTLQDYGTIPTDKFTRYSITFTTGNASGQYRVRVMQAGSSNNTNSFIIANAQLEQLSYATSYIPTSGASATRNQELCVNATPVINSAEGTLYAEILKKQDNNDNFILISLNNAASNSDANSVTIGFNNSNDFYFRVKSPNGDYTSQTIAANKNQFYKVALKYKSGDIAAWIDGVEVATSTNTFLFAEVLDNLSFDYNGNSVLPFFGDTKGLKYYPKALADVQLEDLTTI